MIPHKPNQLDERLRSEERWGQWFGRVRGLPTGDGEIRPLPGQGEQETIVTAQDHPGFLVAPEDPTDVSPLPTGGTLFSQDRGPRSLKCNIRCCLFWD